MKAVLGDDTVDTTGADREAGLPELLGDDFRGSIGVEKAMPNDLAHEFIGASIVRFGSARFALQRCGAVLVEGIAQLMAGSFISAEVAEASEGRREDALYYGRT